ncbi:MAG: betaine/proline/choline family ABC transporter ATP-binding protein [Arenicellales bacterium]|nr:betaine/proline/choline family ABC transporter ATP-binding protein [Arenicellales bacterium]
MSETPKIVCNNVWKIFGAYPEQTLKSLDHSLSRAEVQARTGHVVAVKDVSFEVNTGETFVVMGLSGSGKSTLVRCISRLIEPTAGAMIIDGEDIMSYDLAKLTELRRYRMSMVFQHFGLFPHRKVIDNISFGLEIRGMDKDARKAKSLEVLQKVGLDGWAEHFPRELSGGMQQRVGLARAMAVDPEILIFDEPFSALDPLIRREMQDELLSIQAEVQKTMIFITHDFLEAIKMGDRIAIMKDGVVVQIGTPEEIVTNPVDDYVREFTEDVPRHKVVSVGRVMQAVSDPTRIESAERIHHKAKIDSLIDIVTKSDGPMAVIDDENRIVGEVTQTIILKAMSSRP